MIDAKHSFINYLDKLIRENFTNVNFYPEPEIQIINYPCIVIHWGPDELTSSLNIWKSTIQIDVLFTEFKRFECNNTTVNLLRLLNISQFKPGFQARSSKIKFVDDTGKELHQPQIYPENNSDIRWRLVSPVQPITEEDKPELIRYSFSLDLLYKDC